MAYDKFAAVDSSTLLFPPSVRANLAGVSPNVIINGGFDIWQRGTTINSVGNTAYSADMWSVVTDGVGTVNITQQNVAAQGIGSRYALRAERSAGTNRWVVLGMFEGALANVGKTMTLSGYIRKGAALTSDIGVGISARTAKFGTSYDAASTTVTNASLSSSTFTRFSLSFPLTTATSGAGADLFEIEFSANQAGTSNAFFELAGIQLEVGSTATPFRRNANSIQGELAACRRYFQVYGNSPNGNFTVQSGIGTSFSTSQSVHILSFDTPMRTTPSVTSSTASTFQVDLVGVTSSPVSSISFDLMTENMTRIVTTFTTNGSFGSHKAVVLAANNTGNARIYASAEL